MQNWKVDMMSALGESVSFGRFLTEPLEWGKWSAFAHNRYLEEAAVQARPGSVAQKKAFFEEHYGRKKKRKSEDHSAAADDSRGLEVSAEEDASRTTSSAESSCMTDQALAPGDEETGVMDCGAPCVSHEAESSCMTDQAPAPGDEETGVMDCGAPCASHEPVGVAEELASITDAVSPCRMDAPVDELCYLEGGNVQVAGAVLESQEMKHLCSSNLMAAVVAVNKQLLKVTDTLSYHILLLV
jgi:hypothetical protein